MRWDDERDYPLFGRDPLESYLEPPPAPTKRFERIVIHGPNGYYKVIEVDEWLKQVDIHLEQCLADANRIKDPPTITITES